MIVELLIVALAGWRLASLLVYEDGPFDMFARFRRLFQPDGPITNPIGKMLTCVWCTSIWTCALAWGLWQLEPVVLVFLAASALAIAFEKHVR